MKIEEKEANRGDCTVAIAMSGGVDSSAAAGLLKDQGYNVIGVTSVMTSGFSRCCSEEDIQTASKVAEELGIEHHVMDHHERFESDIIDYFKSEYISGRTPSPCSICNSVIKFGVLLDDALKLGADKIATGHYSRISQDDKGQFHLHKGADSKKDQSYFLFMLTQEQLSRTVFPLAGMTKPEVSEYVYGRGLASRQSKESQELCFIDEPNHGTWIDVRSFDAPGKGDVLDVNGAKVGTHNGIHHYTIGQRRGLGVAMGRPVYVIELDPDRNVVVIGDKPDAMGGDMLVKDLHWISGEAPSAEFNAVAQIRYNHSGAESVVRMQEDGSVKVEFKEKQFAVTPGQTAVFYDGDEILGGGFIS